MEIQIGDYIRTKKEVIAKVLAYQDLTIYDDKGGSATFHSFETDKGAIADIEVEKHSKNIIDLIEVGDYVNGELVVDIMEFYETLDDGTEKYCGRKLLTQYRIAQYKGTDIAYYIYQDDIKSIATHQSFKQVEYEV